MPPLDVLVPAALAVILGGLVQSGLGLGLGMVAAPVVTLLDPTLMPGAMLVAGFALPALILARERGNTDWGGISWALAGRVFGTVAGVAIVATVSPRVLGLIVGSVVLVAVALAGVGTGIPRNRWTLVSAGLVSGSSATSTSIGGPPVALLYQHESGPRVRASLSAYFVAGNLLALTGLAVSGHLPPRDLAVGAVFICCALIGFLAAGRFRVFLDSGRTRAAVLAVAVTSAIILIGHSLLG